LIGVLTNTLTALWCCVDVCIYGQTLFYADCGMNDCMTGLLT